tara:strand:- start:816 stop:1316 length:501 start_codon:yes stop_codon:yes gene_type:complete
MSEISNQLKSQTLGNVVQPSFRTVGSRVFPDLNASNDILDLVKIVDSWRSTHAQTYGNVLPNSGKGVAFDGTQDIILAPADNEAIEITGISLENAGVGNIGYELSFGDGASFSALLNLGTMSSGEKLAIPDLLGIKLSKGYDLRLTVTSGTAIDLIGNISYVFTCQ